MAIELELTVADKGSATVRQAASNMAGSLRSVENVASGIGRAFQSVESRILNITSRLFSFQSAVGTLTGAAGLGLLGRQLVTLAEETGNEQFNDNIKKVGDSWSGFTTKLGKFIAENPAVNKGLEALASRVKEWGDALVANKDVIDDWARFASGAVAGVAGLIGSATRGLAGFSREAPIANMSNADFNEQFTDALWGFLPGGNPPGLPNSKYEGNARANAKIEAQYPSRSVAQNFYFGQKLNRNDITSIIAEMERNAFRSGGGTASGGYDDSGESEE